MSISTTESTTPMKWQRNEQSQGQRVSHATRRASAMCLQQEREQDPREEEAEGQWKLTERPVFVFFVCVYLLVMFCCIVLNLFFLHTGGRWRNMTFFFMEKILFLFNNQLTEISGLSSLTNLRVSNWVGEWEQYTLMLRWEMAGGDASWYIVRA